MRINAVFIIFLSARQLHKHTYHSRIQKRKLVLMRFNSTDIKADVLKKRVRSCPFIL